MDYGALRFKSALNLFTISWKKYIRNSRKNVIIRLPKNQPDRRGHFSLSN